MYLGLIGLGILYTGLIVLFIRLKKRLDPVDFYFMIAAAMGGGLIGTGFAIAYGDSILRFLRF